MNLLIDTIYKKGLPINKVNLKGNEDDYIILSPEDDYLDVY